MEGRGTEDRCTEGRSEVGEREKGRAALVRLGRVHPGGTGPSAGDHGEVQIRDGDRLVLPIGLRAWSANGDAEGAERDREGEQQAQPTLNSTQRVTPPSLRRRN
jgi:hypothetical protein